MKRLPIFGAITLAAAMAVAGCSSNNTSAADRNRSAGDQMAQNQPAAGTADRQAGEASRVDMNVSSADRQFMMEAAQGGMMEVEVGRLAQDKGQTQAVKDLGKTLVDDHSAANDKLKKIAGDMNVTLPAALDSKHQGDVNKLSKLSGAQFDKQFLSMAVKDHQKDIREFEKEANNGQNPEVKSFASDNLPVLRKHLDMAQAAEKH